MPNQASHGGESNPNMTEPRSDSSDVFVRLESATVFVRDPDVSLRFYVDTLGFRLVSDIVLPAGMRFTAVSAPNVDILLIVIAPPPGTDEYSRIGRPTYLTFMTADILATYKEWSRRGVHFL